VDEADGGEAGLEGEERGDPPETLEIAHVDLNSARLRSTSAIGWRATATPAIAAMPAMASGLGRVRWAGLRPKKDPGRYRPGPWSSLTEPWRAQAAFGPNSG
jgi:hypothetical protein